MQLICGALKTIQSFGNCTKKYAKVTNVVDTVNSRIEDLRTASEPARLGDKKHAPYRNTYGINITKSVRQLYTINYRGHKILLVANRRPQGSIRARISHKQHVQHVEQELDVFQHQPGSFACLPTGSRQPEPLADWPPSGPPPSHHHNNAGSSMIFLSKCRWHGLPVCS